MMALRVPARAGPKVGGARFDPRGARFWKRKRAPGGARTDDAKVYGDMHVHDAAGEK